MLLVQRCHSPGTLVTVAPDYRDDPRSLKSNLSACVVKQRAQTHTVILATEHGVIGQGKGGQRKATEPRYFPVEDLAIHDSKFAKSPKLAQMVEQIANNTFEIGNHKLLTLSETVTLQYGLIEKKLCKCRNGCQGSCGCQRRNVPCSSGCGCKAGGQHCSNPHG